MDPPSSQSFADEPTFLPDEPPLADGPQTFLCQWTIATDI